MSFDSSNAIESKCLTRSFGVHPTMVARRAISTVKLIHSGCATNVAAACCGWNPRSTWKYARFCLCNKAPWNVHAWACSFLSQLLCLHITAGSLVISRHHSSRLKLSESSSMMSKWVHKSFHAFFSCNQNLIQVRLALGNLCACFTVMDASRSMSCNCCQLN